MEEIIYAFKRSGIEVIFDTIPTISLSENLGQLVVHGPNFKVEIFSDGNVVVAHSNGTVSRIKPGGALDQLPTNVTASLQIGAGMPGGAVYAGISPDTGGPMYTTPNDSPLMCTFDDAARYAKTFDAHGRRDWRMPTKAELNVLFDNRAAIGNFDTTGSDSAGWYWSSSRTLGYGAWAQRFSDGCHYASFQLSRLALRCVRG
jgi:hypothetical protein